MKTKMQELLNINQKIEEKLQKLDWTLTSTSLANAPFLGIVQ